MTDGINELLLFGSGAFVGFLVGWFWAWYLAWRNLQEAINRRDNQHD